MLKAEHIEDSSKWISTPFSRRYNNRWLKICLLVAVKSLLQCFHLKTLLSFQSMTSENLCEPSPILAPLVEILCEPRRLWRHGSRAPVHDLWKYVIMTNWTSPITSLFCRSNNWQFCLLGSAVEVTIAFQNVACKKGRNQSPYFNVFFLHFFQLWFTSIFFLCHWSRWRPFSNQCQKNLFVVTRHVVLQHRRALRFICFTFANTL